MTEEGSGKGSTPPSFEEAASDALRYWERRRLLYNIVLTLIVLGYFFAGWPASKSVVTWNPVLGLFMLIVLANVCYCAAYVVDLFVQLSGFHATWDRRRWVLLIIGIAFAGVITRFFSMGILTHVAD